MGTLISFIKNKKKYFYVAGHSYINENIYVTFYRNVDGNGCGYGYYKGDGNGDSDGNGHGDGNGCRYVYGYWDFYKIPGIISRS